MCLAQCVALDLLGALQMHPSQSLSIWGGASQP